MQVEDRDQMKNSVLSSIKAPAEGIRGFNSESEPKSPRGLLRDAIVSPQVPSEL
jgi:hypothetical protein